MKSEKYKLPFLIMALSSKRRYLYFFTYIFNEGTENFRCLFLKMAIYYTAKI